MNIRCIYRLLIMTVTLLALAPRDASAQMMALRTDMTKDLLMTPSFGLDFVVGEKQTLGVEVIYNNHPWKQQMQLTSVMPEFRYWFNGRPFTRQYIGAVASLSTYSLAWSKNVYDGDALGIGLSFGHVWTLSKRWNIDFSASVGVLGYRQKYYYTNDYFQDYGERTNAFGYLLMPIKLGISAVYVLR